MKRFSWCVMLILVVFASSCLKDPNNNGQGAIGVTQKGPPVKNSTLTGRWNLVAGLTGTGDNTYMQLNANGATYGTTFPNFATYVVSSDTLKFTQSDETMQNYLFKINSDTLSMNAAGQCTTGCSLKFKKGD